MAEINGENRKRVDWCPTIPIKCLDEFFNCTICLSPISGCVMTRCGHRYCGACIKEWIDRNHTCPCCNAPLSSNDFYMDHQFDCLISLVVQEQEKAENLYFIHLAEAAEPLTGDRIASPVEAVLKKHLKHSLAQHEKYFQSLKKEYDNKCVHLERRKAAALEGVKTVAAALENLTAKQAEVEEIFAKEKANLKKDMEECEKLVAEAYDRYLSNHLAELEILPVKVSVSVLDKNIHITDFSLKPADNLLVLRKPIGDVLVERGDPAVQWDPASKFFLFGPLSHQYYCQEIQQSTIEAICHDTDSFPDVHELTWHSKPILQHSMLPGSILVVTSCVECESDMPQACFSITYDKGNGKRVDYYNCQTCKFRWICKPCMLVCHKGHNLAPHVMNHLPQWACCYCPKNRTCHLQIPVPTQNGEAVSNTLALG